MRTIKGGTEVARDWTDGEFELEIEKVFTVRFQEIRDKVYWQAYLKADEKGEHDLRPYLSKDDAAWIMDNIIDKIDEIEEADRG